MKYIPYQTRVDIFHPATSIRAGDWLGFGGLGDQCQMNRGYILRVKVQGTYSADGRSGGCILEIWVQ
jgi:hypothetical protein